MFVCLKKKNIYTEKKEERSCVSLRVSLQDDQLSKAFCNTRQIKTKINDKIKVKLKIIKSNRKKIIHQLVSFLTKHNVLQRMGVILVQQLYLEIVNMSKIDVKNKKQYTESLSCGIHDTKLKSFVFS